MPFRARNTYYLRISEKNVLPMYVYLDERHLEWMSDRVLQHVISDLRPQILDKLRAESDVKSTGGSTNVRGTVDTHRGDNYQFCYFLRKTEPHSIIIKKRTFEAVPAKGDASVPISTSDGIGSKPKKRKAPPANARGVDGHTGIFRSKRHRPQARNQATSNSTAMDVNDVDTLAGDDDYHPSSSSSDEGLIPANKFQRRGRRSRPSREDDSDENDLLDQDIQPSAGLYVEEEEEKPKPALDLKFRGFDIFGRCLCVVVEPWPHFQYSMPACAPSLAPIFPPNVLTSAANRITEAEGDSNVQGQTPLFLSDDDDQRETSIPLSTAPQPHPLFTGLVSLDDEESDGGGMMAFSQILHNTGDYRAGAVDDDGDGIGEVFFGDADELKQI